MLARTGIYCFDHKDHKLVNEQNTKFWISIVCIYIIRFFLYIFITYMFLRLILLVPYNLLACTVAPHHQRAIFHQNT